MKLTWAKLKSVKEIVRLMHSDAKDYEKMSPDVAQISLAASGLDSYEEDEIRLALRVYKFCRFMGFK